MTDPLMAYRLHATTRQFRARLRSAQEIMQRAADLGRAVVMSSWGKDSVVMVHIARGVWEKPTVLHVRSPASLDGTDAVIAAHRVGLDYHELERSGSLAEYVEWVRAVGLPHDRPPSVHRRAVTALKVDPAAAWMRKRGYEVMVLGLRIDESLKRRILLRQRSPIYRRADGWLVANPLAYWTSRDVWAYIADHNLAYHRLYDAETHGLTRETLRNTGWLSTDGAQYGRIAWLRHHFPDHYRRLATEFPEVTTYA